MWGISLLSKKYGSIYDRHQTDCHEGQTDFHEWTDVLAKSNGGRWEGYSDAGQWGAAGWTSVWEGLQGSGWRKKFPSRDSDADGTVPDESAVPDGEDDAGVAPVEPGEGTEDLSPPSNPQESVELVKSTQPIRSTHDGQVIEDVDLHVQSGDAITVTHDNVIIRNVRVIHDDGNGINVQGASNLTIESSEITHGNPPSGTNPHRSEQVNVRVHDSPELSVDGVIVSHGSSGFYLENSPGAELTNVEGHNFHGPFPRGQFVQFNNSGDSSLTNFYAYNDPANSHPEDIVSVFYSPNVTISNGLIDGNNSVTGVGVMFEGQSQGGRVEHVDAVNQGNGAFSSYSDDVEFISTRSFDNIDGDQGRGMSSSNGLIWNVSGDGVSIVDSTFTNPGNEHNIAWDLSRADTAEIYQDHGATPADPISVELGWT